MSTLREWFYQVNTWLVVALLALAGWTADALRMFLGMHDTLSAGLGAFVSHFWYAVPMIVAIVVLTKLRPTTKLLGAAAYDGIGTLIYQQGEHPLDAQTISGMLAALRNGSRWGVHGLTMATGDNVYFLHDAGITIVACFSGPASPQQLSTGMQMVRAGMPPALDLMGGLEPPIAALAANIVVSPLKREIVAFFHRYRRTAIQAEELAYWVNAEESDVMRALDDLLDIEVVQRQCVCDATFYRLTVDEEVQAQLDELFAWRDGWQTTLEQVEQTIGSKPDPAAHGAG